MARAGIGDSVEGLHAVRAAIRAGRIAQLYTLPQVAERHPELGSAVQDAGGRVEIVNDLAGLAETATPQGVVARGRPIATRDLVDLVEREDRPALVVLDHLEDPHNVGAIARTAAASGMTGLVVAVRRSAPLGVAAFKAAAGALESVPVAVVSSVAQAVKRLTDLEVWTVGLDAEGDRSLFGLELLADPIALVVGSEGRGMSRLVTDRVDVLARIPMVAAQSLNASVAAAIGMYEIMRTRQPG